MPSCSSHILRQTQPAEHPSRIKRKEVAIGAAHMARRRGETTPTQDHLACHELAVVLADRAVGLAIARIGDIGARGPFPYLPDVVEPRRRDLPFLLARQPLAGPFGEGGSLVTADMADRLLGIDRLQAGQGEDLPVLALPFPIKRRAPAPLVDTVPAS